MREVTSFSSIIPIICGAAPNNIILSISTEMDGSGSATAERLEVIGEHIKGEVGE